MITAEVNLEKTDEILAEETQKGSMTAFSELVNRHQSRLFHYLSRKTGNLHDAEDLAQQAFVRAYQNIKRFDTSRKFTAWLYTIAHNLAVSHFRKNAKTTELTELNQAVDWATPAKSAARKDNSDTLWHEARDILSASQYDAAWLRYGEDLSIAEIAVAMKKSQTHVKVLLHRARGKLAKHLEKVQSADNWKTAPTALPLKAVRSES